MKGPPNWFVRPYAPELQRRHKNAKNKQIKHTQRKYYSLGGILTFMGFYSFFSVASFLSIGCATSILSLFSANSILSIASVNSVLSFGCSNRVLQICNSNNFVTKLPSTVAVQKQHDEKFLIAALPKLCYFGSCDKLESCLFKDNTVQIDSTFYTLGPQNTNQIQTSQFYNSANVYHPLSLLLQYKPLGGKFTLQTLTDVIQYNRVPKSIWKESLSLKLSLMIHVFDFQQIFALYKAELLSGQTNGFCRGGNTESVEVYRISKQLVIVPTQSIEATHCNAFSHKQIKPITMADCAPMQKCFRNKDCTRLFKEYIQNTELPCAYSYNEYYSLISAPAVSSALLTVALLF